MNKVVLFAVNSMMNDSTMTQSVPSQQGQLRRQTLASRYTEAYEIFVNTAKAAVEKKDDVAWSPIIAALEIEDPTAREVHLKKNIMKLKKDILTKGIVFLEVLFQVSNPSSESSLKDLRIEELRSKFSKTIIRVAPNSCYFCDSVFDNVCITEVKCFNCDSGMCLNCCSHDAYEKARNEMKMIAPLCSICRDSMCANSTSLNDATVNDSEVENILPFSQPLPSSSPPSNDADSDRDPDSIEIVEVTIVPNEDVVTPDTGDTAKPSEDDTPAVEEPFVTVKNKKKSKSKNLHKVSETPNALDSNDSKTVKDDTPVEEAAKVCAFYIQFRCKHGRSGKDCSFSHPKICLNYMKQGVKGCSKKDDCDFLHPDMCQKSLAGSICSSKRCFLGHVQGTRSINSDPSQSSSKDSSSKDSSKTLKKSQNFQKGSNKGHVPGKNFSPSVTAPFPPPPSGQSHYPYPPPNHASTAALLPQSAMVTLLQSVQDLSNQISLIQKSNQEIQIRYIRDRDTGRQDLDKIWNTLNSQAAFKPPLVPQSQSPPPQGSLAPQVVPYLDNRYPQYSQIVQGTSLMGAPPVRSPGSQVYLQPV